VDSDITIIRISQVVLVSLHNAEHGRSVIGCGAVVRSVLQRVAVNKGDS